MFVQEVKVDYQKQLDRLIEEREPGADVPTLALHSCCGPCSSYVLEYLAKHFRITLFYYNPNIDTQEEFERRASEQSRLIDQMDTLYPVTFVEGEYEKDTFAEVIRGSEEQPEGGGRCLRCYEMRLRKTAEFAKADSYDYFTTTLSVSPHKNSQRLGRIAERVAAETGVANLPSDFKKREGYKRSIELAKAYDLYRQDYCGCVYSRRAAQSHVPKETDAQPSLQSSPRKDG